MHALPFSFIAAASHFLQMFVLNHRSTLTKTICLSNTVGKMSPWQINGLSDGLEKKTQSTKEKRLAVLLKSAWRIVYFKLKSAPNCFLSKPSTDTIFATDCIKPPRSQNNLETNPSPLPVETQTKPFQLLPDCNTLWFPIAMIIIQHLCKVPKDCYSQSYSTFVKHNGVFGSGPCTTNLFVHALGFYIIQLCELKLPNFF